MGGQGWRAIKAKYMRRRVKAGTILGPPHNHQLATLLATAQSTTERKRERPIHSLPSTIHVQPDPSLTTRPPWIHNQRFAHAPRMPTPLLHHPARRCEVWSLFTYIMKRQCTLRSRRARPALDRLGKWIGKWADGLACLVEGQRADGLANGQIYRRQTYIRTDRPIHTRLAKARPDQTRQTRPVQTRQGQTGQTMQAIPGQRPHQARPEKAGKGQHLIDCASVGPYIQIFP